MLATLIKMTRPVNIVIAVVTLFIGLFLIDQLPEINSIPILPKINFVSPILLSLGFAFAIGFGNIQNDVLDFESDKLNRPERPLPSGKISLKAAKFSWISMMVLTIICGIADSCICYFNYNTTGTKILIPAIFFIALALLLIAYNKKLKHIPLLKNMTVAFLCMTPLILTLIYPYPSEYLETDINGEELSNILGFIHPYIFYKLLPAMMFAFLLTTSREIYKDLEDETGDLKAGIMTFPLIAGAPTARRFAGALLLFTWILLPFPVMRGFYPILFLIISASTLTPAFIYILLQAKRQNYHKAQGMVKIAMFAGLIALVVSEISL